MSFDANPITELASRYVNSTQRHIFLTGKAGTGKTTFLQQLVKSTFKKTAVAAPTGIAAINAGGVTLHSLFQLPFGVFVPDQTFAFGNEMSAQVNTPKTVLSGFKINKTKRQLIQELELLIIDEVSMLRADLLDCIDLVLRHIRRNRKVPFGGLQILFIGDLLQLPPVVKDSDQRVLGPYYKSNYFFAAHALRESTPIYVELDKIYRQHEQQFVDLLNKFRTNHVAPADLELLNSRYRENLDALKDEYVQITTHNRKADHINEKALEKLETKRYQYRASIEGDFPDSMYPVSPVLYLKEGAQVMFVKNDRSEEKRYFNGKTGKVTVLTENSIEVTCPGDSEPIEVETLEWENVRYSLNKNTNEVDQNTIGQFRQYPLKLAWAITVHKSQGLTFEKAILDLSDAFAPGQVYVALSRLTSLDGLVLSSRLTENFIANDHTVASFGNDQKSTKELTQQLEADSQSFITTYTTKAFDFGRLLQTLNSHLQTFDKEENKSTKQQYLPWTKQLIQETQELKTVADTFIQQIKKIMATAADPKIILLERVSKAKSYFEPLINKLQKHIHDHVAEVRVKKKVKKYLKELDLVESAYYAQKQSILKAELMLEALTQGRTLTRDQLEQSDIYKQRKVRVEKKQNVEDKKPTYEISYELYKEGLSLEEIAEKRNLVPGTIAGHLCHYIGEGSIAVDPFISSEKLANIIKVSETLDTDRFGEIKSKLGDEYTYADIKFAMAHKMSQVKDK